MLVVGGSKLSGRQSWRLLWESSRVLSVAVLAWAAADAIDGPLVIGALGVVVGLIPNAVAHGISSADGHRLIGALIVAALLYAASLVLDPIGGALSTVARQRITDRLQARLLRAVTVPATIAHLEDQDTLNRLASAEGSLTGFFPGDAPVTWVGSVAGRLSGVIGCAVIAAYFWWLGLLLLVMWLVVRRVMLRAVLRQAIDVRGQTTEMRRAWYLTGVGSKARDAKEVRVFGLARFLADRYARQFTEAIGVGMVGLRGLHRRAAACFAGVLAGYALAIYVISEAARTHQIGLRALAIMLPMLAVTAAVGSVSYDDVTLAQSMFGLPDADRLEQDLLPPPEPASPPSLAPLAPHTSPTTHTSLASPTSPPLPRPRSTSANFRVMRCGSKASASTTGSPGTRAGTTPARQPTCWPGSTSNCGRAPRPRSSVSTARASPPWSACSPGSATRPAAGSPWTGRTCASSPLPAGSGRSR